MVGWLVAVAVAVAVVVLAAWLPRQLSRGGFATTLGRLVVFPRSAGSAAMVGAPSLPRFDRAASPCHGATNRWRQR